MDALARLNGTLVGRYQLEREIGRGGMATVYLARDLRHQRFVAFKLLDPELGAVAVLFPLRDTREANATIEPLAYLEQARIAEALHRDEEARTYYQRFLWRYDTPPESHRHLRDEAQTALVRLARATRGERNR
jgi:serine/threonine protein kinase